VALSWSPTTFTKLWKMGVNQTPCQITRVVHVCPIKRKIPLGCRHARQNLPKIAQTRVQSRPSKAASKASTATMGSLLLAPHQGIQALQEYKVADVDDQNQSDNDSTILSYFRPEENRASAFRISAGSSRGSRGDTQTDCIFGKVKTSYFKEGEQVGIPFPTCPPRTFIG
jgi:hypothetical protein